MRKIKVMGYIMLVSVARAAVIRYAGYMGFSKRREYILTI